MISISAYPLPAYQIFIAGVTLFILARIIQRRGKMPLGRLVMSTALIGTVLTAFSVTLKHGRHAGTRFQVTNGWPKPMCVRWLPDESSPAAEALIGRGVLENLFFYTAVSSLLVSMASRVK